MTNPDLTLALELADAADAITRARLRAVDLIVETKPDLTPVSEADRAVEGRSASGSPWSGPITAWSARQCVAIAEHPARVRSRATSGATRQAWQRDREPADDGPVAIRGGGVGLIAHGYSPLEIRVSIS